MRVRLFAKAKAIELFCRMHPGDLHESMSLQRVDRDLGQPIRLVELFGKVLAAWERSLEIESVLGRHERDCVDGDDGISRGVLTR